MLSPMFILNCIRSRLVPINSNLSAKNGWSGDSPGPIRSLFVSILFLNVHCSAWLPSLQCWLMRNCSFFECEQILHYQIRWKFFRLLQELLIKSQSFSLRVGANGLKFLPFYFQENVRHSGRSTIVSKVHLFNHNICCWSVFNSKQGNGIENWGK